MKKYIYVLICLALLALAIFAARNKSEVSNGPIKIGVVYGFTGAASTWADMGMKGIDLAVKEINNDGGINGRKIEVFYEDSQTNPTKSVSAFNKLVLTDRVDVVLGDVWAFITNPLIPLVDQQKIVLISPTVIDASVEKSSPYFYTLGHTIESQRDAVNKFFDINKEIKTISVICWNDTWGMANKDLVLDVAKQRNIKILSEECLNDFSATYQSELTKIKALDPDAIYFNTSLPDVVLKRIKDLGLGDKKALTLSTVTESIEVNKINVSYLKNIYFANWVPNEDFSEKFKKEYGIFPITESQNHYDAIRAIAMAIKNGGELNTSLKKIKFTSVEGYQLDFTKGDQLRVNEGKAGLYTYDGEYHEIK
jgi:branched-chain amino acid transport system substrate-binding protein